MYIIPFEVLALYFTDLHAMSLTNCESPALDTKRGQTIWPLIAYSRVIPTFTAVSWVSSLQAGQARALTCRGCWCPHYTGNKPCHRLVPCVISVEMSPCHRPVPCVMSPCHRLVPCVMPPCHRLVLYHNVWCYHVTDWFHVYVIMCDVTMSQTGACDATCCHCNWHMTCVVHVVPSRGTLL